MKKQKTVLSVHQNASYEIRLSEVAYTVSTNSNASGRNTPIVMIYYDEGTNNPDRKKVL